jgi:hypothetical protein
MEAGRGEERGREISSRTKNVRDGEEVSLRKPTHSQERMRKKKRRLAPFEMKEEEKTQEEAAGLKAAATKDNYGLMARTRRGLPEPLTILRGAAMTTAPVGGS